MTISLPGAVSSITQETEILNVLHDFTVKTVVPATLLECFIFGACTASILLGSYMLWSQRGPSARSSRIPITLLAWSLYTLLVAHWILTLRQLLQLLSGRALGLTLTFSEVNNASVTLVDQAGNDTALHNAAEGPESTFVGYESVWKLLVPLVTETTLLGCSTVLLLVVLCTTLLQMGGHWSWRSSTWTIPAVTTIMYAISLSHWAASISLHNEYVQTAMNPFFGVSACAGSLACSGLNPSIIIFTSACLSINIIFSDAIVLWRMYVVWDKARFTVVLSFALVLTTTALSIANLAGVAGGRSVGDGNKLDSEVLPTFGDNSVGLATAFMSFASNVCATGLVGLRTWMLRKDLSRRASSSNRSAPVVGRVMELLVDSGVAYTAIWLLYLLSFFFNVTTHSAVYQVGDYSDDPITAGAHLDAAMAQLTTIYPLIILLLIGINRAQRPRLMWEQDGTFALTVNIEPLDKDIEGSQMLDTEVSGHVHPGVDHSEGRW